MLGKSFWGWIAWFLFLLLLDFVVPFVWLKNVPKITGSYLFWILWIAVGIGSMFLIFLRWREPQERGEEGGQP
jgi:hypothetical protein